MAEKKISQIDNTDATNTDYKWSSGHKQRAHSDFAKLDIFFNGSSVQLITATGQKWNIKDKKV